ncbi:MAG: biopolymer transporter ExbD [Verrucomicrobiae bacterium]|nr:biopolymer transporter ExbD [Verrucomicrobiae bacterium]
MRFYPKTRSDRKPTIIIVSMVDIFTVILIFFIATTTFKKTQPVLKIDLPKAGASSEKVSPDQPALIAITPPPNEKIFFNKEPIDLAGLEPKLRDARQKDPKVKIALEADQKASFGLVVKVMDVARKAGFEQLPAFIEPDKKPGAAPAPTP